MMDPSIARIVQRLLYVLGTFEKKEIFTGKHVWA